MIELLLLSSIIMGTPSSGGDHRWWRINYNTVILQQCADEKQSIHAPYLGKIIQKGDKKIIIYIVKCEET